MQTEDEKLSVMRSTIFDDVLIFTPRTFKDFRGCFFEFYNSNAYAELDFNETFVQDNASVSAANVIRGLHYQWDKPMGKLIYVSQGEINDVIVDLRKNSKTFGHHQILNMDSKTKQTLWVPGHYAHGFVSMANDTIVNYKCTAHYNQNAEAGVYPFDKDLNIQWTYLDGRYKFKANEYSNRFILSAKDMRAGSFADYYKASKF